MIQITHRLQFFVIYLRIDPLVLHNLNIFGHLQSDYGGSNNTELSRNLTLSILYLLGVMPRVKRHVEPKKQNISRSKSRARHVETYTSTKHWRFTYIHIYTTELATTESSPSKRNAFNQLFARNSCRSASFLLE